MAAALRSPSAIGDELHAIVAGRAQRALHFEHALGAGLQRADRPVDFALLSVVAGRRQLLDTYLASGGNMAATCTFSAVALPELTTLTR